MIFPAITRLLTSNDKTNTGVIAALLMMFLTASPALASSGSIGFGVSFLEDGVAIYVPVNLTDYMRIEPVVSMERITINSDRSNGSDITDRELTIGAGVFGLRPVGQSAQLYYGMRLLHLRKDGTETDSFSREESEYRGYQAHALAGLEYSFGSHFSISGEAGLEYTDVDVTFRDTRLGRDEQSVTETRTRTNLIARFYF